MLYGSTITEGESENGKKNSLEIQKDNLADEKQKEEFLNIQFSFSSLSKEPFAKLQYHIFLSWCAIILESYFQVLLHDIASVYQLN